MSGHIRSIFKCKIFFKNMFIMSSFVSGFRKLFYFYIQIDMPRAAFQKSGVITFTRFLPLQSKNKLCCFEIVYVFLYGDL